MESTKAPSPSTVAIANLVAIWSEVAQKRVSFWVGVQDSMIVMERRRIAREAQPRGVKAEGAPRRAESAFNAAEDLWTRLKNMADENKGEGVRFK
ncbi:MAG TPA: hypothetical protein VN764_06425 [Polyangiaceae bacterium]|nr:hypothetical protein [Polyangiaceae bacterium]